MTPILLAGVAVASVLVGLLVGLWLRRGPAMLAPVARDPRSLLPSRATYRITQGDRALWTGSDGLEAKRQWEHATYTQPGPLAFAQDSVVRDRHPRT